MDLKAAECDDFFEMPEEGTTFVLLPRLGIGLGESIAVFSDGSYVVNWSPLVKV